jgi:predicted PurR-regulated permease PerM
MNTEFTLTQKRALAVATVIAILFAAYFLRGYFTLIVVAAIGLLVLLAVVQISHMVKSVSDWIGRTYGEAQAQQTLRMALARRIERDTKPCRASA